MLRAWHVVAALVIGLPAAAAPVWESAETVAGLAVYRDHQDSHRFYYEPAGYRIAVVDDAPQVFFRIFRYLGTAETRDQGEFRISAILSIDAEQATVAERYGPALQALRRRDARASLRPLPVDGFVAELTYAVIGGDEAGTLSAAGSGGAASDDGGADVAAEEAEPTVEHWTQRRFTIPLDELTAQLFWDNFENDRLQLSLSHRLVSAGMRRTAVDAWERDERSFANTMPVHISMQEHASHFSRTETWALANRRRTDVVVTCYDYTERADDELFRVTVDVRFKTLRNQDYVETVRFDAGAVETDKTISFRLARNLDEPYLFRVTRLFHSLPEEKGPWIEHRGLILDVTDYAL
jgi:hypothetical protein